MEKWGDADGNGIIDVEEVKAFLDSDEFKKMTNCEATPPVKAKVTALAMAYAYANGDNIIDLNELQAIKDSGFCNCLCVEQEDEIENYLDDFEK